MLSVVLLLLLLFPRPALALKTDIVELTNGDILTGEIKSLDRGKLTYKTDTMQTVEIKWAEVARLSSTNEFLLTLDDGSQYYGMLTAANSTGELQVSFMVMTKVIPLGRVVRIERIKKGFVERLELSVALGFSYTQASQISQLTFDGRSAYKDRTNFGELTLSTIFTDDRDDTDGLTRQFDAAGTYRKTLTGRLFGNSVIGGQGNDELGLDLRLYGILGAGLYLLEHNSNRLSASAGFSLNRERYTGEGEVTNNTEAVYTSSYSLFFYETPKTDIQLVGTYYDGLDSTRFRLQFDASLSRELVKDFFVALTYYDNYDSAPPESAVSTRDRGVVAKISWNKY